MSKLFPPISPYSSSLVKVNQIHSLYVEESGNKKVFLLFFHGGPGSLQILITEDILTLSFIELFFLIKEDAANQSLLVR